MRLSAIRLVRFRALSPAKPTTDTPSWQLTRLNHGQLLRQSSGVARRQAGIHVSTVSTPSINSHPQAAGLPFSLKILLENLLRTEDGLTVRKQDIEALANWNPKAQPDTEIAFMPARVLLQDFTGVPTVVDLAAMRDAMVKMGGDPKKINPLLPAELVIDHSVQVDDFGSGLAFRTNADLEFQRNRERYAFLRWGQKAFRNFKVVPPDTGIVHQVNLEYLARVVFTAEGKPRPLVYPDTLVGTDSHTTMINGLGVLGWGVGGIEAEAAMLGQPVSMLIPDVIGFRLHGKLPEGATATDLVLTVTEMLRKKGVVGKFVEFYGSGLAALPLADRATIANMAPEYGATCGIFPVDAETLRYLRFTGRPEKQVQLVEAYMKEQGLFHDANTPEAVYSDTLALDLATVVPSLAGPKRPQDRVALTDMKKSWGPALQDLLSKAKTKDGAPAATNAASNNHNRRPDAQPQARRRGHRGHHQLHEYLESVGNDGGRPARQEGRRARPDDEAVGQNEPGAGIEGSDRLPDRGRRDALIGGVTFPPGRLRLHDLHRQQRPAARGSVERHRRRQSRGRRGAERQSQFRGPRSS